MFETFSFLFVLCLGVLGTMAANGDSSFPFENGFVKSPSLDENVGLFGDSKLVSESSSIQLTDSVSGSEGRVVCRKPIKLFQGNDDKRNTEIFSTYFSFSMPNEIGDDVLAFVMVPSSFDLSLFCKKDTTSSSALGFLLKYAKTETVVAFEFDISKRGNNIARILIGRPESAQISNISFEGDLMMNYGGGVLSCLIEYDASSKRMLVRFRKPGSIKMLDPFFNFSVDLAKLWEGGEFMMGLSSVNGNSSKPHFLHSWGFEIKHLPPTWMHSEPLQPKEMNAEVSTNEGGRRSECVWRLLGALLLGLVCGALGALSALYLWTTCAFRRSVVVVPEEYAGSIVVVAIEQVNK